MKKIMMLVAVGIVMTGVASAYDPCGTCAPNPCAKPKIKYVEVCETIQVEVPVTEYVEEPCEVKVTKMVPCEKEVEVCEGKWVFEERIIPYKKQVIECEEYTAYETRTEMRRETRTRKVCREVPETIMKTVYEDVCVEECDACTGKAKAVHKKICKEVPVTVMRKVWEEECYEVDVPCKVKVPVTRTRQVCKLVDAEKCVRTPVFKQFMTTKKVTVMVPQETTKTVMKKRAVCATKTVEKVVRKKVPVEEPCTPCPAPAC
ncbi:MAG: hypothetical protein LBJ46_03215 [Planctomycetota bacterium]|jgi:hypothetical protein|nr:hypothetical protein [Planctomycetota bacterium]